ncbi:glycosyltransferase family 2 protein [bacterium]|nr:glycosyltransferase family 2 protein [bacterium]
MNKTEIEYIVVACCTCLRPETLRKSLKTYKSLIKPEHIKIDLLVVDNDKEASAYDVASEFGAVYFVEENRGIANARNRVLKEAVNLGATHIAMFDDDGLLDENWLLNHVEFYKNNEVNVVSGPQYVHFDKEYPKYIQENNIFKTGTTKKNGQILKSCATNNVFMQLDIVKDHKILFNSEKYVFMGGEDGDFFSRVTDAGFTIRFNKNSIVKELIEENRANIKWILDRYYYNGYSGGYLKFGDCKDKFKKFKYLFKTAVVFGFDYAMLFPSMIFGKKAYYNMLGMTLKTKGKLEGAYFAKPLNYYEKINGK